MSTTLKDNDSGDSDCFIVNEIKPVKKPLVQKTLLLGVNKASNILYATRSNNKKKDKVRKASTDSAEVGSNKKRTILRNNGIVSKKTSHSTQQINKNSNVKSLSSYEDFFSDSVKNNSSIVHNSAIKQDKIEHSFSIELQNSQSAGTPKNESSGSTNTEKIELSPGISRKRKRFKINEVTSKSLPPKKNVKKPLLKMFDAVEEVTTPMMKEFSSEIPSDFTFGDDRVNRDNSQLLCFLVKEMIKTEIKSNFRLLLESDKDILEIFFSLKESACRVFVRMLGRKKHWHRVSDIVYKDISDNLENEFEILYRANYVDVNIGDEDLKIQMNLLKKPEILSLCKAFNVSFKFIDSNKKETLINSLIQECQKQKSAIDMFKGKNSTRLDRLKSEVKKYLGMCIRLNSTTFLVFYKILLLSSFAHYYGEEDQRFTNELLTRSQVHKKLIKFPSYKISSVVIFETVVDFEEYRKAVLLQDSLEVAICNKNYEEFVSVFLEAKQEFEKILRNNEYEKHYLGLKPFLRKFTAGTVYARILTKYCTTFKKKVDNSELRNTAELLLSQNLFLTRKRSEWYEVLSKTFKNQKQNNAAAEIIIKALNDPLISEVQKLALQLRGQLILKTQTCGVSDDSLRNVLNKLCVTSLKEPETIEINGRALGENEPGRKCVYILESQNGKRYMTVEERAISYYKSNGFTKGYHTEGLIIQSLYFLLFFDVIYGLSPEGVFLSPYQEGPLDFNSTSFYENRKEEIDLLLSDMSGWDDNEMEAKIRDAYLRNYGTTCLVKWSEELTLELFCEVAKCISVPVLVLIFQRLIRNFRQVRAGFPDLTLWNPTTNKCKFVEVKSPSDRLSPGQRVWLDFLRNIGLDCEVCNVKNVSGKFSLNHT